MGQEHRSYWPRQPGCTGCTRPVEGASSTSTHHGLCGATTACQVAYDACDQDTVTGQPIACCSTLPALPGLVAQSSWIACNQVPPVGRTLAKLALGSTAGACTTGSGQRWR